MFKKISKKRILITATCIVLIILLGVALIIFTPVDIPNGSIAKIEKYTRNKPYARLSIAIITPSGTETTVYGHDGKIVTDTSCEYEIGELTQTFLGALTARSIVNGNLSLSTKINEILPVPSGCYNPSIEDIVSCKTVYGDYLPAKAGLSGKNLSGINDVDILMSMPDFSEEETCDSYNPSQFGAAVLGTALAELSDTNCFTLLNNFVHLELGLKDTYIATTSVPSHGSKWSINDTFIASSGIVSTINDMSLYVRKYLTCDVDYFELATTALSDIDDDYNVGFFWNIAKDESRIFFSGSTEHYNSIIIMNKHSGNAIVVLSNYADDKFGTVEDIANAIFSEIDG